ncbi:MAG: histidine phosphatase family protein [Acidimicrobiia bacterium]|nr:histidine phosphatase family protein [Acidimicrobiia bacterium]
MSIILSRVSRVRQRLSPSTTHTPDPFPLFTGSEADAGTLSPVQVILVRHGQPVAEINHDRIADPGLSELGQWQARRLQDWLAAEPVDAVVTSPKRRAIETVQPVIDAGGLPHRILDDLDEIDRGSFIYHPTERLPIDGGDYWDKVMAQQWDDIGWDPPEAFAQRIAGAWEQLVADPPGDHVLVGCHGGTIRFVLGHVLGLSGTRSITTDYAAISRVRVDLDSGRATVHSVNETGHFDASRSRIEGAMRDGRAPGSPPHGH